MAEVREWSYSGNPATSTLDKVRFLIGDTDIDDRQLSDLEINAILADNASEPYATAITCVEGLISKYSRRVTKSVGDLSISYSEILSNYRELLAGLRRRATIQLCKPYAGGISIADKQTDEADSDRVQPSFYKGMHDMDGTQTEQAEEN